MTTSALFVDTLETLDPEAVAELLRASNDSGRSPILLALTRCRPELIDVLIARGIAPDLHEAAAIGSVPAAQASLVDADLGARDSEGWTALHYAAFFGHPRVVELLCQAGAPVNARSAHAGACSGCTPLHAASAAGRLAVVQVLLEAGARPDARDEAGYTALHQAVELGHAGIVKALLMARASVDALAGDATPLGLAIRHRRMEIAALLRQCGGTC